MKAHAGTQKTVCSDDGFVIVGIVMGCGKVRGRWDVNKNYMNEEETRGPWTKEQHTKHNEATLHITMSKFGIIIRKIVNE